VSFAFVLSMSKNKYDGSDIAARPGSMIILPIMRCHDILVVVYMVTLWKVSLPTLLIFVQGC